MAVGAGVIEGATFSFATTDGEAVDDDETYPDDDEDEPRSVAPRLVLPPAGAPVLLTPPTEPEPRMPLLKPRLASALDKDSRLKLSSPLKLLGRGGKPPPAFVDIVVVVVTSSVFLSTLSIHSHSSRLMMAWQSHMMSLLFYHICILQNFFSIFFINGFKELCSAF